MIRNMLVRVTGDSVGLRATLASVTSDLTKASRTWDTEGSKAATVFKTLQVAAAAAGVAATVALVASVKSAVEFEARMRNVNSLVFQTPKAFKATEQAVLDLSKTVPKSANDLAEGLYDITSSGFSGAGAMKVLKASATAATAGLATTKQAATAISAALNAYGESADQASTVSDTLFQTVKYGVIDFSTLSNNLGHVVTNAAAAKIPLSDVGAAIATMTLSGQRGDVAATSLNNLIQKLTSPTKELSALYKSLGYDSGEAAIKQEGLLGVVKDIGNATGGGQLSGLQSLLHDMQAVRGASALLTNQGKTYTSISAQMSSADKTQGATARALAEQLKSTKAQLQLFANDVRANAIELGLRLLPSLVAVLHGLSALGRDGVPAVKAGFAATVPLLRATGTLLGNVGNIAETVVKELAPTAGLLLGLGGSAVLHALTAVVKLLGDLTGVIADHPKLLLIVVAVLAGRLIPALIATVVGLVATQAGLLGTRLGLIRLAFQSSLAGAAMASFGDAAAGAALAGEAALAAIGGPAGLAVIAALAGITLAWHRVSAAEKDAASAVAKVQSGFDALDPSTLATTNDQLEKLVAAGDAKNRKDSGALAGLVGNSSLVRKVNATVDEILPASLGGGTAVAAGIDAQKQIDANNAASKNTQTNLARLATQYGLTTKAAKSLAKANDVDLTKPWKASADEITKFKAQVTSAASTAGVTTKSLGEVADAAGITSAKALTTFTDAVAAVTKATGQALASNNDVLGTLTIGAGDDDLRTTNEALTKAKANLAEIKADYAGMQVLPASATKKLADAQSQLTDAQAAQSKAAAAAQKDTLSGAYSSAIATTTAFSTNITAALRRGLDPTVISKLLQEGPTQAEPILQAILADSSGKTLALVNDSEKKLDALNTYVVEQSRLTALAVNASTDKLSSELATAMSISQKHLADPTLTASDIAKSLGLGDATVLQVASDFGIAIGTKIATGVKTALSGTVLGVNGKDVNGNNSGINASIFTTTTSTKKAYGGLVTGPGGPRDDAINARLSNYEYVHQASAVKKYGVPFMNAVNAGTYQLPRFASGGLFTGRGPSVVTVRVPVTETHTASAPINIEHLHSADVADFETQAARRRRLASLGTPRTR